MLVAIEFDASCATWEENRLERTRKGHVVAKQCTGSCSPALDSLGSRMRVPEALYCVQFHLQCLEQNVSSHLFV